MEQKSTTIVLFDFDGTLTKINTLIDFAIFCFGKSTTYWTIFKLLPYLLLYNLGILGHASMKSKYIDAFFKGQALLGIVKMGEDYCLKRLPEILNNDVYAKLLWHQKMQHKIVIASASLSILLQEWCKKNQIDLIATDVRVGQDATILGMQGLNCYGKDKVTKILAQVNLKEYDKIIAYADSNSDIPMLDIANEGYWVESVDKQKTEMEAYVNEKDLNLTKKEKFIRSIVNQPVKILLTFLCLFLTVAPFLSKITEDFTYRSWFSEEDPLVMAFDSFERKFNNDDTFAIIVQSPSGIFDKESIQLIHKITEKSWIIPEVFRVDSITNYNWAHATGEDVVVEPLIALDKELTPEFLLNQKQVALNDEILPGYLISKDGNTTVIYLTLRPLVVDYKSYLEGISGTAWYQDMTAVYQSSLTAGSDKLTGAKKDLILHIEASRKAFYEGILNEVIAKEKNKGGSINIKETIHIVEGHRPINFDGLGSAGSVLLKELTSLAKTEQQKLKQFVEGSSGNSALQYEVATNHTKALVEEFRALDGDHKIMYTGSVPLNDYFREASYKDLGLILPLVNLLILILLYVSVRSFMGMILPMSVVLISIIMGMSSIGFFSLILEKMSLNSATMIAPIFIMAIGIADSVHILMGVNYFLKKGLPKNKAVYASLEKNFGPTILTSVTTALAFFSFSSSGVIPIGSLGIVCGIGTIFAWFATYFVFAPLLILVPYAPKIKLFTVDNSQDLPVANWANAWGDFVAKNKGVILLSFGSITIVATVLSCLNVINSDPYKYFKDSSEIRQGLDLIENEIGSPMTVEISINTNKEGGIKDPLFLHKVVEFEKWIKSQKNADGELYVTKTFSILDVIREMNFSLKEETADQYIIPDSKDLIAQELLSYNMGVPDNLSLANLMSVNEDSMRLIVMWTVHNSEEALAESYRFKTKAESLGLDINIGGKMDLWHSLNPKVVTSFYQSIIIAVICMSILLFFVFRSVEYGFYALLANFIPLLFGGAVLKLIGKPLDMGTVVVFSVGLGIAVDDTIHFLYSFKKAEEAGLDAGIAVKNIFTAIGPALFSTTLILAGSFSMYILGEFVPNSNFGVMLATILTFAFITDMVFLPALLMYLKRKSPKKVEEAEGNQSIEGRYDSV